MYINKRKQGMKKHFTKKWYEKKQNVEGLVLVSVEIYVENQYVKKQDNGESAEIE